MGSMSKFIIGPEEEMRIITIRDIFQSSEAENKFSSEYQEKSAVILLSPEDMKKIGAKENDHVKISNQYGTIIVSAKKSDKTTPGTAMMPNSIYSNVLVSDQTDDTGIPSYKNITANIMKTNQEISSIEDILKG